MNAAPPSRPSMLTFFPDYRATNPYQALLYKSLEPAVAAEPGTIAEALKRLEATPGRFHLFHLHWEHALLAGTGEDDAIERFLDEAARFRHRGGRIIWTIHNLAPHDLAMSKAIADLQSCLVQLADILHLHSLPAMAAAQAKASLPARKIRVIPHQNYEGAYPVMPRAVARSELAVADARMVVLCPGRIAPYKQPAALIRAFLEVAGPQDRLIIAGETARGFKLEVPKDERVIHRDGFATPEEVGRWHAAADFVVLPYRASLTSGSAILAATLGRAVLGPETPGLRDAVAPPETGVIYPPDGLAAALAAALAEGAEIWAARGAAAAALAAARSHAVVAAAWLDVMASLERGTVLFHKGLVP